MRSVIRPEKKLNFRKRPMKKKKKSISAVGLKKPKVFFDFFPNNTCAPIIATTLHITVCSLFYNTEFTYLISFGYFYHNTRYNKTEKGFSIPSGSRKFVLSINTKRWLCSEYHFLGCFDTQI